MNGGGDAPGLVGRGGIWALLTALLDDPAPRAAILAGEAGIGKSALAAAFAAHARERGRPVATTNGADAAGEAYAGLRALLPVPESGDPLAMRAAACAALAAAPRTVLVVDDVDRLDPPSLDVLLTIASMISWGQLPATLLVAGRPELLPPELTGLAPQITVPALTDGEATRLLDLLTGAGQPAPAPSGGARLEILRRAAGNPLALHEFATRPAPPTGTVTHFFVERVRGLPPATLTALTLAAAGERHLAVLIRAAPATSPAVWQPAEDAGLITVTDATVRFRHPLVEYAVLHAAGPEARRAAHRLLAAATPAPRSLWHLAHAAAGPDPALAARLTAAAQHPDLDAVSAIGLLEQACALLPAPQRPPLLLDAAARAAAVGRVRWAAEIVSRAWSTLDRRETPRLEVALAALTSWTLTMSGRLREAGELLSTTMRGAQAPPVELIASAGFPAFLTGHSELSTALRHLLTAGDAVPLDSAGQLFSAAVVLGSEPVKEAVLRFREPVGPAEMGDAATAGAGALLVDEPEHALRLLRPAVRAVVEGAATGVYLGAPGAAGWALIDTGRWVEAEEILVPLLSSPVTAEAPLIRAGAFVQLAVIAWLRGHAQDADRLLGGAQQLMDVFGVPAFALRLRWARGLSAAADGDSGEAARLLTAAFEVAHDWRWLVLPDLVAAGREELPARPGWASERVRARLAAAEALREGDPGAAADGLEAVCGRTGAGRWPFERAVLGFHRAERLRRAQRPGEARTVLLDAADAFERLGASGWARRSRAELRTHTGSLARLSAQQLQIIRLAGEGLSNREIGERLSISPRTVGSHLYRVFPLLGVTNRTQLGVLLAGVADGRTMER